jgi:Ca2+-transporting ATPase
MSGDGINDSPAIKAADIGLAMGIRGTEVTKSVADIILTDDNYHTIAAAVAQGRVIYRNIKLVTSYLFSSNFSEILLVVVCLLAGLPMPFNARLLLWLNVVTDFLPSLALAYEPIRKSTMQRKPNPKHDRIIDGRIWVHLFTQAVFSTILVFSVFVHFRNISPGVGVTAAFTTLALGEVFRGLTARSHIHSLKTIGFLRNKPSNLAVIISSGFVLILIYLPFFRHIFGTVYLSPGILLVLATLALILPLTEEITKYVLRRLAATE